MNLKPAPFALTPQLVGRILDALPARGPSNNSAVRPNTPPVAADSPTEPARIATMQAIPSAPAGLPPAPGRPDTSDTGTQRIDKCNHIKAEDRDPPADAARGPLGWKLEENHGQG